MLIKLQIKSTNYIFLGFIDKRKKLRFLIDIWNKASKNYDDFLKSPFKY